MVPGASMSPWSLNKGHSLSKKGEIKSLLTSERRSRLRLPLRVGRSERRFPMSSHVGLEGRLFRVHPYTGSRPTPDHSPWTRTQRIESDHWRTKGSTYCLIQSSKTCWDLFETFLDRFPFNPSSPRLRTLLQPDMVPQPLSGTTDKSKQDIHLHKTFSLK